MEARIKDLNCVDVTPPESPVTLEESRSSRRYLSKPEPDFSAFSDSEVSLRQSFGVNGRSNKTNVSFFASHVLFFSHFCHSFLTRGNIASISGRFAIA